MAPILASRGGISASAFGFGSLVAPLGDYQAIMTATVDSGGSGTISFTGIPQTFKHLQIRGISRMAAAAGGSDMLIRFNGDTASNYSYHLLQGNGASAVAAAGSTQTYIRNQSTSDAGQTANVFDGHIFDILDYTNASKGKTLRGLVGGDYNGSGYIRELSGGWYISPTAITQIDLIASATTFVQYSQFALFGLKG